MKQKIFLIIFSVLFFLYILYLQFGRPATIHNVTTTKTSEGYVCQVTIIANKLVILDKQQLQDQILQKLYNNEFKNMLLSEEMLLKLTELHVIVYANQTMQILGNANTMFQIDRENPLTTRASGHNFLLVI